MMREPGISLHSKQTNNSRKFTDICKDDDDIDGVVGTIGTVGKYEEGKDGKDGNDKSACGDSEVNQDETIIKNKNGNND